MNSLKFSVLVFGLIVTFGLIEVKACEFDFKITSENKQLYKVGDEIVVEVLLTLTHRNCPDALDNTKFDFTGIKALGATKWKELPSGKFERKFKLQVIEDAKGKCILSAKRTCDKDGGAGSIKFNVK